MPEILNSPEKINTYGSVFAAKSYQLVSAQTNIRIIENSKRNCCII